MKCQAVSSRRECGAFDARCNAVVDFPRDGVTEGAGCDAAVAKYLVRFRRELAGNVIKPGGERLASRLATEAINRPSCKRCNQRALEQALRFDDRIIVVESQPTAEFGEFPPRRSRGKPVPPAPQGDRDHPVYSRVHRHQRGVLFFDHPVDSRIRKVVPDVRGDREVVDDIAERRHLDQQDAGHAL